MCVQALLSFQIGSLDVLTNASVTAKIAACGMYIPNLVWGPRAGIISIFWIFRDFPETNSIESSTVFLYSLSLM